MWKYVNLVKSPGAAPWACVAGIRHWAGRARSGGLVESCRSQGYALLKLDAASASTVHAAMGTCGAPNETPLGGCVSSGSGGCSSSGNDDIRPSEPASRHIVQSVGRGIAAESPSAASSPVGYQTGQFKSAS